MAVLNLTRKIYIWALCLRRGRWGLPKPIIASVADRELRATEENIVAFARREITERQLVKDRLNRRWDPGATLNEVASRAMAENAERPKEEQLTGNQLAAMKVQKEYLERIARKQC